MTANEEFPEMTRDEALDQVYGLADAVTFRELPAALALVLIAQITDLYMEEGLGDERYILDAMVSAVWQIGVSL